MISTATAISVTMIGIEIITPADMAAGCMPVVDMAVVDMAVVDMVVVDMVVVDMAVVDMAAAAGEVGFLMAKAGTNGGCHRMPSFLPAASQRIEKIYLKGLL